MEKTYPFSVTKHAHDIEYYHNHLYNIMRDMEGGEIPMDNKRYDNISFDSYEDAKNYWIGAQNA